MPHLPGQARAQPRHSANSAPKRVESKHFFQKTFLLHSSRRTKTNHFRKWIRLENPSRLALPSVSPFRPSRPVSRSRSATPNRAVAPPRIVFATIPVPTVPSRTVVEVISAPLCPREPLLQPSLRQYALADVLRPPSPRRCSPINGRGPRHHAVAAPKTDFWSQFVSLSHLRSNCYTCFGR